MDRDAPEGGAPGKEESSFAVLLPAWDRDEEDVSLIGLANVLLRHRRTMAVLPLVGLVLAVSLTLVFVPDQYSSEASFRPEVGSSQLSQLSGLAAQFGVSVPIAGQGGPGPAFYADLLDSREVLRRTVVTAYRFPAGEDAADSLSGDLVELWEPEGRDRAERVVEAIDELRDRIQVDTRSETGVVSLVVTTRWPGLSHGVAARLIELLNEFNNETRQSRAKAEREWLEERVAGAKEELKIAQDSLQLFLEQNREWQNAPRLRFEHDRLQQQVQLQQQVYTSLVTSYEQARLEAVRNTPVITVVDPPEVPVREERRGLLLFGLVGLALGALAALMWVFASRFLESTRSQEPDEYEEFARLKSETRRDLRRLWDLVRFRSS